MMHALATEHECATAEKRVNAALADAIRDRATPALFKRYRAELEEIAEARLLLPEQRQP